MDPLGAKGAVDELSTKVVPQVTEALAGAERSIAADLDGAEKAIGADLQTAIGAFANGVSMLLGAINRLDGGTISITGIQIGPKVEVTFSFPTKPE